jgi:hypothetical protein
MSATGYQGDPSQFNSWLPQQDAATQAAAAATTMPGGPQTAAGQAAYDAREVQRAQAKQEENAFHGPDKMAQQAALAQRMGYAGPPKGFQRWYTGQQRAAQQQARAAQPARGPSAYDEYMAWAGPQAQAQPAARGGAIEDGEDDGQPETYHGSGLIHSSVAGRTDRIPMSVAAGAYVIPADVVSGLGEGNTLSGAKVLDMMMHTGPFGMKLPEGKGGGRGIPAPPPLAKFARGGRPKSADDLVKVIVAGGEYVVHPMDVAKWAKNGDLTKGHDNLDKFVKNVRSDTATKLKKLPGPKT